MNCCDAWGNCNHLVAGVAMTCRDLQSTVTHDADGITVTELHAEQHDTPIATRSTAREWAALRAVGLLSLAGLAFAAGYAWHRWIG